MNIIVLITTIYAYFIGAIPTGYIIARCKGIADIRSHGSGNIGATNVSRVLGTHYFFLTFLIDAGKAFLFVYTLMPYFSLEYLYFFAGVLLFGNGCSIFLRGSGGKGVATLCGLLAAFNIYIIGLLLCVWLFLLIITHTVGIASVGAAIFLPFYAYTLHNTPFFLFSLFSAFWIVFTHRSNLLSFWKTHCSNN